jgi:hypothetical protein
MNQQTCDNVMTAAAADLFVRNTSAKQAIAKEMTEMVETGEVNILTDEEERMLRSLRRFKATCKPGSIFKWQTRPTEGVTIHPGNAPAMIHDPQEVA